MTGIMIHGIHNPYPTAFDLFGSNDRNNWELVLQKNDLGEELYHTPRLFNLSQNKIYKIILLKITNNNLNMKNVNGAYAGIYEMDYFGELYHFIAPRCTYFCRQNTFNFMIYVFILMLDE